MESITDPMSPGSVFVPPAIRERRWKYTRFLIILGIIIAAAYTFTPYAMKLWLYELLMVAATIVWVIVFLGRLLFLDRWYIANDPRPPWFELTGSTTRRFLFTFFQWILLVIIDGYLAITSLGAEPTDTVGLALTGVLTIYILAVLTQLVAGISPRFRATKLATFGRII